MELSVVVVSWNVRDFLEKCLLSVISEYSEGNIEIWLVENASTDGSLEMVRNHFPQVQIIISPVNIGFGPANNLAISQCKGRYILLLNPDTEVKPGALQKLTYFMDENPKAGCAGPLLLNPDGTLQTSSHPFPSLKGEFLRLFHITAYGPYSQYQMGKWNQNESREVDVLQGACMILRREAIEQVGVFDQDFFMYSEEVDLCFRIRKAGWPIYWYPVAQVIHYGGQSTQQVAGEMFLRLYQGKLLFFKKHRGWLAMQVYKFILLLAALLRLIITPLAWLEPADRKEKHIRLAKNYLRLIAALPDLEAGI